MQTVKARTNFQKKQIELLEKSGKKVTSGKVVNLADLLVDSHRSDLIALSSKIYSGDVSALKEAGLILKKIHLTQMIKGKGGLDLTNKDYGKLGAILKKQYYAGKGDNGKPYGLRHLADDVSQGKISEKMLAYRLSLFAESGKLSYSIGEKETKTQTGYKSKRRILNVAENCPSCIRYASFGWVGINSDELPHITQNCECGVNCKCSFEYSRDVKKG